MIPAKTLWTLALSAALVIGLGGCVTPSTKVSDVNANKMGHLMEVFSPLTLSPEIRSQIPKGKPKSGLQRITIKTSLIYEDSNNAKEKLAVSTTYVNAGDGLIQKLSEYSGNDIPYTLLYSLEYSGIVSLKSRDIRLNQSIAGPVYEVKNIKKFSWDASSPRENGEYVFDYQTGTVSQGGNFSPQLIKCLTGKYYPANTMHPKFPGNAIDFSCERHAKGVMLGKMKYAFLQQYGITVMIEESRTHSKMVAKVSDVTNN